ncbi:hypothetical protein C8J56DRAFT_302338 [Mycena floridula]|nr:hypothetical protein C8J56DRAFT_302338 [Mycena floridula]
MQFAPVSPVSIFLDPGGIIGRRALIKTLEALGGTIAKDPADARYIVVNAQSYSGRQFIRDWGQDGDKTVLESSWVGCSQRAGHLLHDDENWGGCLALDDGLPLKGETEEGEEQDLPALARPIPLKRAPESSSSGRRASSQSSSNTAVADQLSAGPPFVPDPASWPQTVYPFMVPNPNYQLQQQQQLVNLASTFSRDVLLNALNAQSSMAQVQAPVPGWPVQQQHMLLSQSFNSQQDISSTQPAPSSSYKQKQKASSPPETPQKISKKPPALEAIFVNEWGSPFEIFVQVDLKNRNNIMNAIKSHGGKPTSDLAEADIAILSKNSTTFKALYKERLGYNKSLAVSSSFILDSVSAGKMVAFETYEFAARAGASKRSVSDLEDPTEPTLPKKSRKSESSPPPKLEKSSEPVLKDHEAEESIPPRKRMKKPRQPMESTVPKAEKISEEAQQSRPGSPNPPRERSPTPPTTNPRPFGAGYLYSTEEDNYALTYARFLLGRDYTLSQKQIAIQLNQKMPHHSVASWNEHLRKKLGKELEEIERRAGIAYRKAQEIETKAKVRAEASSSKAKPPTLEQQISTDLEVLTNFVLNQGEMLEDDAEDRWANLTVQCRCLTERNWEEFYSKHHPTIIARYEEMSG